MASPTYFTCTLGQAEALNLTDSNFTNITAFINAQAETRPSDHAVGFAIPPRANDNNNQWRHQVFTFADLRQRSSNLAEQHLQKYPDSSKSAATIALLSPSTPDFLFTWLALMRLGLSVLLIAPQCQPSAIAQLCKVCECTTLIYDEQYKDLAAEATAASEANGIDVHRFQMLASDAAGSADQAEVQTSGSFPGESAGANEVAYSHHTSGTSSGLPKPIAQTHRAGCGVLPHFKDGKAAATFTTTPLYHGGIADAFRAWTSGALIWLFPGKGAAITAKNIIKCLAVARELSDSGSTPPVKYFSSVPYVLQSMEADAQGLKLLQSMDIVGVGGAALPSEVGDRLVRSGVNLISRFGSAECGFIMSSHRDYPEDKEWQYLRTGPDAQDLKFEVQNDGLVELVIDKGWPHMAKRNREDGSFATSDLFAPHESLTDAWRYHSRADSQLTLLTGKKFDPAPLEDAIATSELLDDVLIFGNGQAYAGALLFRSTKARDVSTPDLIAALWPTIAGLNANSQDHARLSRRMLVPVAPLDVPLVKSSKGTILRRAAEDRFAEEIVKAYSRSEDGFKADVPDEGVFTALQDHIQSIVGRKEPPGGNTDLYAYGVDSISGMRIRSSLRQLLPEMKGSLPLNIVEDCATVERLATFVIDSRHGRSNSIKAGDEEKQLMLDLVAKYSKFESEETDGVGGKVGVPNETDGDADGEVVVLTGVTGALGAHLLDLYSRDERVERIYCLVRGTDDHACTQRVAESLQRRGLGRLDTDKVIVMRSSLADHRLGLLSSDYQRLAHEATIILHAAWSVNFKMRLHSFEDNIAGVASLLGLALRSPRLRAPRFGFCSSVASVLRWPSHEAIPETISYDPGTATELGYSRSKWVAELICDNANKQPRLGGRVTVFRVGQLAGDSHRGVWNSSEAWPLMLSSVKVTGSLPDLAGETLDWLPVNVAAAALLESLTSDGCGLRKHATHVLHVVHPGPNPDWHQMLLWLQQEFKFDMIRPEAWVAQLARFSEDAGPAGGHGAFQLLQLWESAYGDGSALGGIAGAADRDGPPPARFAMVETEQAMPSLRRLRPVDREYVVKLWQWIDENM